MPGKYSHSVVLAGYSSRGMIELPSEQHAAYLKASPYVMSRHGQQDAGWLQTPPTPQKRSQSALAYTGPYTSNHHNLRSPLRHTPADSNADSGNEDPTRYYQQRAFVADVRPRDGVAVNNSPQRQPENGLRIQNASSKMIARPATSRDSAGFRPYTKEERLRVDEFLRDTSNPPKITESQSVPVTRNVQTNTKAQSQPYSSSTFQTSNAASLVRSDQAQQSQGPQFQGKRYNESYTTATAPAEPDFEDFSDSEEVKKSYFDNGEDIPKSKTATPSQRTPPRTPSQASKSRARTGLSTPGDHSDTETNPETLASPLGSHRKVDSMTSMSTTSSQGMRTMPRTNRPVESKKSTAQHSAHGWALPEIDEDATFTPEIFVQDLKDPSSHTSHETLPRDLDGHLMGAVSSGRDVDFTKEEHIESDEDAATPPDIGRYRDEADVARSPAVKSNKSEGMVGKETPTPRSKKGGFFSRFRSKSRPRA